MGIATTWITKSIEQQIKIENIDIQFTLYRPKLKIQNLLHEDTLLPSWVYTAGCIYT